MLHCVQHLTEHLHVMLNAVKHLTENAMSYYVYLLTNAARTLYVGVTNNLERRVYEHKHKLVSGFTAQYNMTVLVHFEETPDVRAAIAREKQIKGCVRAKKITLIEQNNPGWLDLSNGWFDE